MPTATVGCGKEGRESTRPNPVALEALVTITGARPSGSDGSRDLFSEEAATVLVFKDGAVIRLAAPVSEGQLLFLGHKKSKEEVVCQVLHRRSFQGAVCYVELQFTEDRPDFWGVAFPEGKRGAGELKLAEQMQAGATTKEDLENVLDLHNAEAADHLQKEVEALREQLFARDKQKATDSPSSAGLPIGKVANANPQAAAVNDLSRGIAKGMTEVLAPLMPEAADTKQSERAVVDMALPNPSRANAEPATEASGASEELPAEPGVPTSRMAAWVQPLRGRDSKEIKKPGSEDRSKTRSIGLITILVLSLAGGAWYGKWWHYLPVGNKPLAMSPSKMAKPNGPPIAQPMKGKPADVIAPVGKSSGAKEAGVASGDTETNRGTSVATGNGAEGNRGAERTAETSHLENAASEAGGSPAVAKERPASKIASTKKSTIGQAPEPNAGEKVVSDVPLIPAKLLKTVNPVYPPDAMRKFITGDVKAEVVVEPSGRVGEVKVIVGPQALRAAAVEALKQYEFAPATQGGKAVASKTTEVVKFWFNP